MTMPVPETVPYPPQLSLNNVNGISTSGVIDFDSNAQRNPHYQHHHQQQHGPVDPNVLVQNSIALNPLEKQWHEIDQYIKIQVLIHMCSIFQLFCVNFFFVISHSHFFYVTE